LVVGETVSLEGESQIVNVNIKHFLKIEMFISLIVNIVYI